MTLSFIPSLSLTFPVCLDDTLLKTVSSEEEAFAEMRKYLKVNMIKSKYTTISQIDAKDEFGNVIDNIKVVDFDIGHTIFLIRYQSMPKFLTLQKAYFDARERWLYDFRHNPPVSIYDEILNYFNSASTGLDGDQ